MMELKNKNTIKKERIFSYFIDYFLVLLGTIFLDITIIFSSINQISFIKENNVKFYDAYQIQEKIINETKINDVSIESFLKMSIRSKLDPTIYFLSTEFSSINPLTKENDPIYFYFTNYKVNHLENYIDNDDYSELNFLKTLQNSTIFEKNEDYYCIKESVAISVGDYIFNKNDSKKGVYNEALNETQKLFFLVTDDLKNNNIIYKNSEENLAKSSQVALCVTFISSIISYLISYLIFKAWVPSINKKHKTIGNIILKCEPYFFHKPVLSLLIKYLVEFFTFSSVIFLNVLVIRSNIFIEMFLLNFNGFYYFVFLLLFSILIGILSLTFSLIKPINASLSEIFSLTFYKNIGEIIKRDDKVQKM